MFLRASARWLVGVLVGFAAGLLLGNVLHFRSSLTPHSTAPRLSTTTTSTTAVVSTTLDCSAAVQRAQTAEQRSAELQKGSRELLRRAAVAEQRCLQSASEELLRDTDRRIQECNAKAAANLRRAEDAAKHLRDRVRELEKAANEAAAKKDLADDRCLAACPDAEQVRGLRRQVGLLRAQLSEATCPDVTASNANANGAAAGADMSCPAQQECPLCQCQPSSSLMGRANNTSITLKPYRDSVLPRSLKLLKEAPNKLAIHIISHTHWDREWYRPLEQFRRLLVTVMDNVVDKLVAPTSGIEHFHLDSQALLLEDYISARPHLRGLMADMVANNQLGVGPWFTSPDEFLSSGEALVRNLAYGIRSVKELGTDNFSPIGYVPDQFGHAAQMPQIFTQFNLSAAATMRGLPEHVIRNALWRSPDGTTILLLKFSNYCGIHFNEASRDSLQSKIAEKFDKKAHKDANESITTVYYMNGCDHRDLDTKVGPLVRDAQQHFHEWKLKFGMRDMGVREVVHSNLRDVAQLIKAEVEMKKVKLPVLKGELRGSIDHLADVLTSGMSLKRRNWASQELLEVWAEPLHVASRLYLKNHKDESADLSRAWKLVLENHFHDTLCTTSVPMVLEESRIRAEKAIEVAETVSSQIMSRLMMEAAPLSESALFVFNPTNLPRYNELIVVLLRVTRSMEAKPGDRLAVLDVATERVFEATVISFFTDVWDYRHRRGLFRKAVQFNLLKVAMRPPFVDANEMRLFAVNYSSILDLGAAKEAEKNAAAAATHDEEDEEDSVNRIPPAPKKKDEDAEMKKRESQDSKKKKKDHNVATDVSVSEGNGRKLLSVAAAEEKSGTDRRRGDEVAAVPSEDQPPLSAHEPDFQTEIAEFFFSHKEMTLKYAKKLEARKKVFKKTLKNEAMEVEVSRIDGSINVRPVQGDQSVVNKWFRLNQLKVMEDDGSQYLAAFGSEVEPEILQKSVKFSRNNEFDKVSFSVQYHIPQREPDFGAAGGQDEDMKAWRQKMRARLRQQQSHGRYTPRARDTNQTLVAHVLYVLPAGNTQRLLVRVWFSNFPNGGMENFAVRVEHASRCKLHTSVSDTAFEHLQRDLQETPDTKPFHKWVMPYGDACALGIAGRGLYEMRGAGHSVTTTLMRAVNRIGDWASFHNEGAQDFGQHAFEYALFPLLPRSFQAAYDTMALEGRRFASAMCGVQNIEYGLLATSALPCVRSSELTRIASKSPGEAFLLNQPSGSHPGELFSNKMNNLPEPSVVRDRLMLVAHVSPPALVLSSIKKRDAGDGFIVRVYNPWKGDIKGEIRVAVPIRSAYMSQLNEYEGDTLPVKEKTTVSVTVPHHRIVTVLIKV